jgi:AbrB family transcriptional regulator, transcriptional pleiotropic regulator of transition state genes
VSNVLERKAGAAMSDTGIVRRVDDLGRIVIPMELRRSLGINVKDPMSIHVEGDRIILQKHRDVCALCGGTKIAATIKDRAVCADCVKEIRKS